MELSYYVPGFFYVVNTSYSCAAPVSIMRKNNNSYAIPRVAFEDFLFKLRRLPCLP